MNLDIKFATKLFAKSNNILKGLYTVTKWDLPYKCMGGSTYEKPIYIINRNKRKKIIINQRRKTFDKIQHPSMIKTLSKQRIEKLP